MLENIRQIGMFMIIAQTVMHFAAGRHYEKYMKIISGVIVLLLFVRPFVSDSDNIAARWQEEAARIMEQIMERSEAGYQTSYVTDSTQAAVIQQIEEEIRSRLNDRISERGEQVTEVTIDLGRSGEAAGTGSGEELVFERVRITVRKSGGSRISMQEDGNEKAAGDEDGLPETDETGLIRINEIVVGDNGDPEKTGTGGAGDSIQELKEVFAQTLGIAEDRVEVLYLGE